VGTSAVPIIGRHPILLGNLAQTAQAATGGRFQLGIALGARDLMRQVIGAAPDQQVAHPREFLTALRPLLDTGEVDLTGELVTARTPDRRRRSWSRRWDRRHRGWPASSPASRASQHTESGVPAH
jgi:alkanesulfonate monooxygenase SsuD/methylene tetrahydromethanopterin reductase-like flavin-dependent oxidoreductase (luciferase family)